MRQGRQSSEHRAGQAFSPCQLSVTLSCVSLSIHLCKMWTEASRFCLRGCEVWTAVHRLPPSAPGQRGAGWAPTFWGSCCWEACCCCCMTLGMAAEGS